MEVTVEFAGLARVLTHESRVAMELEEGTTFQQILQELGHQYPALVGEVIHPGFQSLKSSNMLNLNGRHMIQPEQMSDSPKDGDRLILMSILAGG